jgi:hypothetical protein
MKIVLETYDGFRKYMEIPRFKPHIEIKNHPGILVRTKMNQDAPPTMTNLHTIHFYATGEFEGEIVVYKQQ